MQKTVSFKIQVGGSDSVRTVTVSAQDLERALNDAQKAAHRLSRDTGLTQELKHMAARFLSVTTAVTAAVTVIRSAAKTISEFERANSTLASVLGTTKDGVSELSEAAKELGRTTEFSASNVTDLQISLARLGFTAEQIQNMQGGILKFASAVGTDLASAADFTGSALRAFGLKTTDTRELLDIMAASTSKSALDFGKLQTSISIVAPIARAFGLDAKQTASFLGVLANNGYDASSAATALRNILLNLADSNGKLAKGIGHSARSFDEIIAAFEELQAKGVDVASVLEMTDKRSAGAAQTLISSAAAVRDLNSALADSSGALNAMYRTMTDNVIGAVNNLKSAWESFMLALEQSKGPMQWVTQRMANGINVWTNLINGSKTPKFDLDVSAAVDEIQSQGLTYDAVGNMLEYWKREAGETSKEFKILAAAREKAFRYDENPLFEGPRKPEFDLMPEEEVPKGNGMSDLAEDIEKYNKAVERAAENNRIFNAGWDETGVRLNTMKSGIIALVNKYGSESEAVRSLISEYTALNTARMKSATAVSTGLNLPATIKQFKTVSDIKPGEKFPDLAPAARDVRTIVTQSMKLDAARDSISALGTTFGNLSDVVGECAGKWLEWIGNLLSAVAQALPALASLSAAHKAEATSATAAAAASAGSSVAGIPFAGPAMAIAAISGIIAAMASLPKFAAGGLAYGPTLGLFGEYAGASTNPEVVAPLSSLKSMLDIDGDGISPKKVSFEIKGRKLVGIYNREASIRSRG